MRGKVDPLLNGLGDRLTKDTEKDEILKSSSLWSLLEVLTFRNSRPLRPVANYGARKTYP